MDDMELTELAAKAAGIDLRWDVSHRWCWLASSLTNTVPTAWHPLTDDGAAFRLAVKLSLIVQCDASPFVAVSSERHPSIHVVEGEKDSDALTNTRRAIVRVAAEMGKRVDAPLVRAD